MQSAIKLNYGSTQYILSEKMQQFPQLSRLLNGTLGYTNVGNYSRAKVFARQMSELELRSMNKILDLGCGYGENAVTISQALPLKKVYALDTDGNALQKLRTARENQSLRNLVVHQGKMDSLPENNFDLIYSVDVFDKLPAEEMPFESCYARLKKGGYLMVKIPNKQQHTIFSKKYFGGGNEHAATEHPGQVYFLQDLAKRFQKTGFRIILSEQTEGPLSRLAWEIGYFMKKGGAVTQLLSLPLCKLLVNLDMMFFPNGTKKGNAITVIGQKI
jgi:precorrin-6B methylase 2